MSYSLLIVERVPALVAVHDLFPDAISSDKAWITGLASFGHDCSLEDRQSRPLSLSPSTPVSSLSRALGRNSKPLLCCYNDFMHAETRFIAATKWLCSLEDRQSRPLSLSPSTPVSSLSRALGRNSKPLLCCYNDFMHAETRFIAATKRLKLAEVVDAVCSLYSESLALRVGEMFSSGPLSFQDPYIIARISRSLLKLLTFQD